MRNQVFKKLFSVLLALIMVAGLLPASVLAEGWTAADVETTPAPTETVQPTEPAEPTDPAQTETPEATEVPEPTPENPAATDEPAAEPTPAADPTEEITIPLIPTNGEGNVAVQAATEISYTTKTNSVPLPDGTFYRIVHLDCGRKYFSEAQIKQIIDYAYDYGYTHVELAFGNDGLRFLLNDMAVTANGTTYTSEKVTSAIQAGNKAFYNAGTNELSQEEMDRIIAYAKGKGIGIIPMFDAPGHLQTVIRAMNSDTLGMNVNYSRPTTSGTSVNWALDPTDAAGVNFVQALMQKYITYFVDKGCTMFNIAADECGFTSMSNDTYTAYAKLVNSMAAMVQNAGMTALAFNDGIYHKNLTTDVEFDKNIAVCYWDASTDKYASAATLAGKDFKIINTNNKWYYAVGYTGSSTWYAYDWALSNINGQYSNCRNADGNYITDVGCMLAIWCDTPRNAYDADKVESLMKALQTQNKGDFVQVEAPKTPAVTIDATKGGVTATEGKNEAGDTVYNVTVKADGTSTIQLKAENMSGTVTWESNKPEVAKVDENGKVTFTGTAGTVTITAKDADGVEKTITFVVALEGEVEPENRTIYVTVGGTATDDIEGYNYSSADQKDDPDEKIATVVNVDGQPEQAGTKTELDSKINVSNNNTSNGVIYDGNGNYLVIDDKGNIKPTTNIEEATKFTVTRSGSNNNRRYTIKAENDYYLYVTTSGGNGNNRQYTLTANAYYYTSWQYNNDSGFYYQSNQGGGGYPGGGNQNTRYLVYSNGWTLSTSSNNAGFLYSTKDGTGTTPAQTTVTFEGKAEGTTYVTIGHVKYEIRVISEELASAPKLPVQLWITNNAIEADNATTSADWGSASWLTYKNAYYVNVLASEKGIYSREGKLISDISVLPNKMERYEYGSTYWKVAKDNKSATTLVMWTGMVHDKTSNNIQTIYGTDYSNNGTEFKYIRYYGKEWAVSADGVEWTAVTGTGSTGGLSNCTQQLVVYYMIRTEITSEITTDVADCGKQKSDIDTSYNDQVDHTSQYFVLLDFRVKYYDGITVTPKTFPVDNKTFAFHCADGDTGGAVHSKGGYYYRDLNNFRAVNTSNYEVYMVTVTMTSDDAATMLTSVQAKSGYTYDGEEQVLWAIDSEAFDRSGLNAYASISGNEPYTGCTIGGDPYIRGVEVYRKHGALITYYIREVEAPDSLTVNYYVKGEQTPFYTYTISVNNGTVFDGSFKRVSETELTGNTVKNVKGVVQTVEWDLKQMLWIGAQYRYTDYKFVDASREEDGKTVNLYYTFNATKTFVVDFGLPLTIEPKDLNENLADSNVSITKTELTGVSSSAYVNADEQGVITYRLKEMISQSDTFGVQYTGTLTTNTGSQDGKTAKYTVTIIPATNVYYEDSFAKFYGSDGKLQEGFSNTKGAETEIPGTWYIDGTPTSNANQALEVLGTKENVYGYDPAYDSCTMFSMGSAHKVTVTSEMAANWKDETSAWPTAQFTFKGTGFDIISLTDNTSGAIFVDVYNTKTGDKEKSVFVDNYYGYTYNSETKTWEATPERTNVLYQIPVIALRNLSYAEHNVVIKVAYSEYFDHTAAPKGSYNFWLDAVRVYDPAGTDLDNEYVKDKEGYPQYIKLRDELAKTENATVKVESMVFIDGGNTADIATYANIGPNNEVYLAKGQAITFKLAGDLSKIATVQIGAKAPNGQVELKVGETAVVENLNTATEMYYDITKQVIEGTGENAQAKLVTITNSKDNILSLTNLKITFTSKPGTEITLAKLSENEQNEAVVAVRALFATVEPEPEPEPEKTFEPDRFEASWSKNVMQGRKATLTVKTSEDVEAITVDGQTIRSYRTRTERVGFGRYAKRVTYREFTYSMVAQETADFSVTAINAEGAESGAITARLTVQKRPGSIRDVWNWFKGWF